MMSKVSKSRFLILFLSLLVLIFLCLPIVANAKVVPYFYISHTNKFTGAYTQIAEYTKEVPHNYYVNYVTENTYSGGWNYWATERYLHYTLNGN